MLLLIRYTPTEPVIYPFKPINRPPKTDWYNETTYHELLSQIGLAALGTLILCMSVIL